MGRLPLEKGAFLKRGPEMAYISNLENSAETLSLTLGTRDVTATGKSTIDYLHYLVGTAPEERIPPYPTKEDTFTRYTFPGGMGLKTSNLPLKFEKEPGEWLSKAKLLVIRRTTVGLYRKPFEEKTFRMADYTVEAWLHRSMGEPSQAGE
ncbi:MAG: hypothetical protein P8Z37_06165 [Acidobacteriota bacterium]